MLKIGNFEGILGVSQAKKNPDDPNDSELDYKSAVPEGFTTQLLIEAACEIPAHGVIGGLTGGKVFKAYLRGHIDFSTGAFDFQLNAQGAMGVKSGAGLHLSASADMVLNIQRGVSAAAADNEDTSAEKDGSRRLLGSLMQKQSMAPIFFSLTSKGSLTLPGGVGKGDVELKVLLNKEEFLMEANGVGTAWGTPCQVMLGIQKTIVKDAKPKVYLVVSLPNGIHLSQLPGLSSAPGINEIPPLAKGASISFSTYSGTLGDLHESALLQTVQQADANLHGLKTLSEDGDSLMNLKAAAISAIYSVLTKLKAKGKQDSSLMEGATAALKLAVTAQDKVAKAHIFQAQTTMIKLIKDVAKRTAVDKQLDNLRTATKAVTKVLMSKGSMSEIKKSQKLVTETSTALGAAFKVSGAEDTTAYTVAWHKYQEALSLEKEADAQLVNVKRWSWKVIPGFYVPKTFTVLPAGTGLGKFFGGEKRIELSGMLDFADSVYHLEASVLSVGETNSSLTRALGHGTTMDIQKLQFEFQATKDSASVLINMDVSASINALSTPMKFQMAVHGKYVSEHEISLSAMGTTSFNTKPIMITMALQKVNDATPKVAFLVSMKDSFSLSDLPGVHGQKDLPLLKETEFRIANFDGSMHIAKSATTVANLEFRNQLWLASRCTIPAAGIFKSLLGGKPIDASLNGAIDFSTGAFRLRIQATGDIGISAGGFKVRATQFLFEIRKGIVSPVGSALELADTGRSSTFDPSTAAAAMPKDDDKDADKADTKDNKADDTDTAKADVKNDNEEASHKSAESHNGGLFVEIVGNGTMALPQGIGHATVGLSVVWTDDALRIEARGDATLFKTRGTVVVGGVMSFGGAKKSDAYVMTTLPDGLLLSNLPGLSSLPGVSDIPTLMKGAKLGYSTFGGAVSSMNVPFLKGDLNRAMTGLTEQFALAGMAALSPAELKQVTKLKNMAVAAAKEALADVEDAEHSLEMVDMANTASAPSKLAAATKALHALRQVAEVGVAVMDRQAKAIETKLEGYVKAAASREELDDALEKQMQAQLKSADAGDKAAKELQAIYSKVGLTSASVQDAYDAAWNIGRSAAKQLESYKASLSELAVWATKLKPGIWIPPINATIPGSTGLGKALFGGKDTTVFLSGHLNLNAGSYAFNVALQHMSDAAGVLGKAGRAVSVTINHFAFQFAVSVPKKFLNVHLNASASISIPHMPGGKPTLMQFNGQYTSGKELSITASANAHFGQDSVWMMLGIRKTLVENKPGKAELAVALMMPDGLEMKNLPGFGSLKSTPGLPKLTRTQIWLSNFDGTMKLPNKNGALVEYDFDTGKGMEWTMESGCYVPGNGPMKIFTGGKDITATLEGRLNFVTGDFYMKVHAVGQVGLAVGEMRVFATQLSVLVQVGGVPKGWGGGQQVSDNASSGAKKEASEKEEDAKKSKEEEPNADKAMELVETDVGEAKQFQISVVANGTVTLPFKMGHGVVGVSLNWNNEEIRFEAQGDGELFNTRGTVVMGALKKFTGAKKASAYFLARLPNGVKLSNIPLLKDLPGIKEAPVLAKNAKIGYSTFKGPIVQLNMAFLKQDLMAAASKLEKYGEHAVKGVEGKLMKVKDEAIAKAKKAFDDVTKHEELMLLEEGAWITARGADVAKEATKALQNVAETGTKLATEQIEEAKSKMKGAIGKAGDEATHQALSAAMEESEKAKEWLKKNKVLQSMGMSKGAAAIVGEAQKAVDAAGQKVGAIFKKLEMGGSVQDAFKEGWALAKEGASQLLYYARNLDKVKAWLVSMIPGITIPRTQGIIPASTGVGLLLGGKDANVTVEGRLNFKGGVYALNASLVAVSNANSALGLGALQKSAVMLGLQKMDFEFHADTKTKDLFVGVNAVAQLDIKGLPGSKPTNFTVQGELRTGVELWAVGTVNAQFGGKAVVMSMGMDVNLR